jgi:hypothetical protein
MNYKEKYLKYKLKYIELKKNQIGGSIIPKSLEFGSFSKIITNYGNIYYYDLLFDILQCIGDKEINSYDDFMTEIKNTFENKETDFYESVWKRNGLKNFCSYKEDDKCKSVWKQYMAKNRTQERYLMHEGEKCVLEYDELKFTKLYHELYLNFSIINKNNDILLTPYKYIMETNTII